MMETINVNDRTYRVPQEPTVVFTIDGGDPDYLDDALHRGIMPRLAAMLADGGQYRLGASEMPSLTNPNNLSIVTGVPPALHGIPGNYCRLENGALELLNDPKFLRAPSIHAALAEHGVPTLMVTAKEKLRRLLGHGGVPSVSVEKANETGLPEYGIPDLPQLVGTRPPGIYDWNASHYAMRIGLAVHRAHPDLRLLYVSLTDRVQHAAAPGDELADRFLIEFDTLLGEYLDEGFVVGITADHGMNAKHADDDTPTVHYLADILEQAGVEVHDVVLPITDPYVRHHGALGSFAWIYLPETEHAHAREVLTGLPGIEEIWNRADASTVYEHPQDRIGDLAVTASAHVALGGRKRDHDLSGLHGALRSHGGRHEQPIPLITSRPVSGPLAARYHAGVLRSRDLHDLVLNHLTRPDHEIASAAATTAS
ncbi:alkaline phosphatase family protein [Streptomyces sp. 110]|uniref:Alkaline phosphatase family protein n=1 Tax=Streptomyces endocoffeicus TaxID=2898945 RepID=A0ABS1PF58_9ACTN|nr:alkaline phosphatase family protein [Streptomyces endocoffeicus]MBL1111005.1 alkaline phosphatase family protein [Streptomyces endocoffeicus]